MKRNLVFLLSILTICVGFIMLSDPFATLEATSITLGIIILIPSILVFIFTLNTVILNRIPLYIISISGIILGILFIGNRVFGVKTLTILFGIYLILTSATQIYYLRYKYFLRSIYKVLSFIINIIDIIFGFLILFNPLFGGSFVGTYIAISVMLQGILTLFLALDYNRSEQ